MTEGKETGNSDPILTEATVKEASPTPEKKKRGRPRKAKPQDDSNITVS